MPRAKLVNLVGVDLGTAKHLDLKFFDAYRWWSSIFREYRRGKATTAELSPTADGSPESAQAHRNSAIVSATQGRLRDAQASLGIAIRLAPRDATTYKLRGTVYAIEGEFSAALKDLTRAVELGPKDIESYQLRASVFRELGELEHSLADMEAVTRIRKAKERNRAIGRERQGDDTRGGP